MMRRPIHLPVWNYHFDDEDKERGMRHEKNDPINILKRFDDPEKKAARINAFGKSSKRSLKVNRECAN